MKVILTFTLFILSLLLACKAPKDAPIKEQEIGSTSVGQLVQAQYHFQIPASYSYNQLALDSFFSENQWINLAGNWEARLYENSQGVIFVALNRKTKTSSCMQYEAILVQNGSNVFNNYFPSLDIYTFYTFEDKKLKQFEGDEQTVFAGYQFDFQEDSLALQFMFCKENDFQSSIILNQPDGKLKKVALMKIK